LKPYQLSKLIRISQGSLSDIENCKSFPYSGYKCQIVSTHRPEYHWLLTGKGPIWKTQHAHGEEPSVSSEELEAHGEDSNLTELIQRLIRTYYRSDAEKKAYLIGFLIGDDYGVVKKYHSPPRVTGFCIFNLYKL
jgi:hypothetical protein